MYIFLLRPL